MLDRLLAGNDAPGELQFFRGELYRLRDGEGDVDRAIDAYREAVRAGGAPSEVYRSLGLAHWHRGERDEARAAFEQYLRVSPEAPDRQMIEVYLGQLESSS